MKRWGIVLEISLNVLSLAIAIAIVGILAQRYLLHPKRADAGTRISIGMSIGVPGIEWSQHSMTLLMVLRNGCAWCEASEPFYRRLLPPGAKRSFHTVALVPQSREQGEQYIRSLGISIDQVHEANFAELHIQGTPTLILVDSTGHVRNVWIGKLSPQQENEVIEQLSGHPSLTSPPPGSSVKQTVSLSSTTMSQNSERLVTGEQLLSELRKYLNLTIVDVRSREQFATGHVLHAANIPVDELQARAPHELPQLTRIYLYCRYSAACATRDYEEGLQSHCSIAALFLRQSGFSSVSYLGEDLGHLQTAGVRIVGSTVEETINASLASATAH